MFVNLVCICIVHISVLPVPQRQGPCHKDATKNICIFLCLWNTLCNQITPYIQDLKLTLMIPMSSCPPPPAPAYGTLAYSASSVTRRRHRSSPPRGECTQAQLSTQHTQHSTALKHSCWAAVQWQLEQVYQAHKPQETFLRLWCCSVAACWGDLPANSNSSRVLPSWLLPEAAAAKCSSVANCWWELDIKCHWEALQQQQQHQAEVFQAVCEASLWQKFTWKASPPLVLPLILLPPLQTTRCPPDLHWKLVLSPVLNRILQVSRWGPDRILPASGLTTSWPDGRVEVLM